MDISPRVSKILNIYYDSYSVPIGIFDRKGALVYYLSDFGTRLSELYLRDANMIYEEVRNHDYPGFGCDDNGSCWGNFPLDNYTILIGPVQIGYNNNFPYSSVPEYAGDMFYKIIKSLSAQLLGAACEVVPRYEKDGGLVRKQSEFVAEYAVKKQFESDVQLNTYDELFECVKNGDIRSLDEIINEGSYSEYQIKMMDSMNSARTIFIFNLSKCNHAAVSGGVPASELAGLTQFHLIELEKYKNFHSIRSGVYRTLYDFAKKVSDFKKSKHSVVVQKANNYIMDHVYDNITVTEIAQYCSMSVSALQHKFKDETGMSISTAVMENKMNKAKFFLEYTQLPISHIAQRLGFCTQSYFNKQFKAVVGKTPKQYRDGDRL